MLPLMWAAKEPTKEESEEGKSSKATDYATSYRTRPLMM